MGRSRSPSTSWRHHPRSCRQYHPLYRVVIDTLFRQLTLHPEGAYTRRLVVLANEFPAFGYMPRIDDGAATLRGYGIKLCLIAQDLEQFWNTYGKDTALWGNLHIKVFHTPENDLTAKRISENLLDTMTIEREVVSYQGWTRRRGTTSTQQHARQLMTTGEVMKMSPEELLLFVGGSPPFKAKKVRWHQDPDLQGPRAAVRGVRPWNIPSFCGSRSSSALAFCTSGSRGNDGQSHWRHPDRDRPGGADVRCARGSGTACGPSTPDSSHVRGWGGPHATSDTGMHHRHDPHSTPTMRG